jgi:transposase-like protein
MAHMREITLLLTVLVLLSVLLWQRYGKQVQALLEKQKGKRRWTLQPKSPADCPACVAGVGLRTVNAMPTARPVPWSMVKGRGGRKKRVETEGQACDNGECAYHDIREADVHALVGNGVRGETDEIQRLLCQACGNRFSVRRHTALQDLKTEPARIELAMNLAAEGVDKAVIARVLGHGEETIARWLGRAGRQARLLHDYLFHDLVIPYLQVDELYTKIRQWAGEKAWLWVAIDPRTKVIPVLYVGGRRTQDAMYFIHELGQRLASGCVPLFTSDGLRQYFWALTAHFGRWALLPRKRKPTWLVDERLQYGQLKKKGRGRKQQTIQTEVLCGSRQAVRETLTGLGFSKVINTSFVERLNLTLRQMIAPLARRTWALAQREEKLLLHLEWGRAYYHFVRVHASLSLGQQLPKQQRQRTPAMAAGLTDHRWRTLDILSMPLVAEGGG